MILHPPIVALLVGSVLVSFLLALASWYAVRILRHWDLASGSELQLGLERRTYLVSTVMGYACAFQVVSLFLFVYTADDLAPLFVGAMCAAGTLYVNPYGYPTLMLKALGAILAGAWLLTNHADTRGRDYPLIRLKYGFLLGLTPVVLAETAAQAAYFAGLKADVITSCCGSLFSTAAQGVASELAALPRLPARLAFYAVMAALLLAGTWFRRRGSGGYVVAGLSLLAFLTSIAALISFISLYIYELPTHHCPFCILQQEYHFIGYPMYALLFGGVIAGLGLGVLHSRRRTPSLGSVLPPLTRRLSLAAMICFGLFAAISTYVMLATPFRLEGY
ncbi:MAG TPA: hypothetical protein VLT62_01070 [Candidatus Methylomirabilis sp.]|nr:hypothetical protein [Candidatus Methylomirabilis sp.]